MDKMQELKARIEEERQKLDSMLDDLNSEESYQQSVLVDQLIEEYLKFIA